MLKVSGIGEAGGQLHAFGLKFPVFVFLTTGTVVFVARGGFGISLIVYVGV